MRHNLFLTDNEIILNECIDYFQIKYTFRCQSNDLLKRRDANIPVTLCLFFKQTIYLLVSI